MNLKVFSKFSPKFQAVKRTLATLPVLLATHQAMAANDVSLPTSDSNWINKLIGWFQTIVDAVSGAGVLLIVFLSACAAVMLWIVVPKNSGTAMGYMARAAAGGIVLFNIGLVIASLQS